MAELSNADFGVALTNLVNAWDRTELRDAISTYFSAQSALRTARSGRAADQTAWNARKTEFTTGLAELHRALAKAVSLFEKRPETVKYCKELFKKLYEPGGGSTSIDGVHRAIALLVADVAKVLTGFQNRIGPYRDFGPIVEDELYPRFTAFARRIRHGWAGGGADPGKLDEIEAALAAELVASFNEQVASTTPNPYARPDAEHYRQQNQEVKELEGQAREARTAVTEASAALLAAVLAFLRKNTTTASATRIREMLRIRVIMPVRVIPDEVRQDEPPPPEDSEEERGLDTDTRTLSNNIESQWQRAIDDALSGNPAPMPSPQPPQKAHRCGAACLTQEGSCQRRTTEDGYCYQHATVAPDAAAQALAGRWALAGVQSAIEHSAWRADLVLGKNGTARWKETKGANPGAVRTGRWNLRDGEFVLRYRAPRTGLVEWRAVGVLPQARSMSGDYRTPQVSPHGAGFGGRFGGEKVQG